MSDSEDQPTTVQKGRKFELNIQRTVMGLTLGEFPEGYLEIRGHRRTSDDRKPHILGEPGTMLGHPLTGDHVDEVQQSAISP